MTFNEGEHPREGDGKFTTKEHGAVDVDLNGGIADVPEWNDIGLRLEARLNEVVVADPEEGTVTGSAPSVLQHLDMTLAEAEDAYGQDRARWLAAINVNAWDDNDHDGAPSRPQVDFIYIDPCDNEWAELDTITPRPGGGVDRAPDLTGLCPFDENGDPVPDAVMPGQFTRAGRELIEPYYDAGVEPRRVRNWYSQGFSPDEAAAWQNEAGMYPVEAVFARSAHGTPEAAAVSKEIIGLMDKEQKAKIAVDLAQHRMRFRRGMSDQADLEAANLQAEIDANPDAPNSRWKETLVRDRKNKAKKAAGESETWATEGVPAAEAAYQEAVAEREAAHHRYWKLRSASGRDV